MKRAEPSTGWPRPDFSRPHADVGPLALAGTAGLWSFRREMRRPGLVPMFALGVSLARRGVVAVVSLAIAGLTILVLIIVALALGKRGGTAPIHAVPLIASSALAWGAGFLHAFGVAAHALRKDRTDGVRHLLIARTTNLRGYVLARVGGLAALLAIVVGGGTLLCGLVAVLMAARVGAVPKTLHATLAAFVFALAFSAVVAPVAFAALGARSRMGGYLFLLGIVVLPEMLASVLSGIVPESITEVLAIPSALATLRASIAPGTVNPLRFVRALVALAIVVGIATVWVRRDAIRVDQPELDA